MKIGWLARTAPPSAAPPPPAAWKREGNDALARGALDEAAACYLQGTAPAPGDPLAWLNLGYVRLEQGQHAQAKDSLLRAEALLPPGDALCDVWCLLGRERQEALDWPAARDYFARVVAARPAHEQAWLELGRAHGHLGDSDEAAACMHRAIGQRGDFAEAIEELSQLEFRRGNYGEALRHADRLPGLRPGMAQAHFIRAQPLSKLGRHEEALAAVQTGLACGQDAMAVHFRGLVLADLGRHEQALADYEQVLAIKPDFVDAKVNAAVSLRKLNRREEALRYTEAALAFQPGHSNAMLSKAILLHEQNRCKEALQLFDEAIALHGQDRTLLLNRSYSLLRLGQLEAGLRAYEHRWDPKAPDKAHQRPEFGVPHWTGESLEGRTIYLFPEQGLGDSIQFMRYIPLVAGVAKQVFFSLPAPIVPLLAGLPDNCRRLEPGQAMPPVDFACSLLSLPMAMGTTLQTIPAAVPYVHVEPELVEKWRRRLGPQRGVRVGLVWSGNATYSADQQRSIPLEMLRAAAPADVQFVSLQKDIRDSDLPAAAAWPGFIHVGDEQGSFADAAALACLVDVVITVDTSVGHMTGALARPWWVMLAHCADWRWMLDRDDSPWYPSVRLFRQEAPGQWQSVIDRVMAEISLLPQRP